MTIDSEQAWNEFVEERSFEKSTSVQGQLDTITSMLADIKTDTERAAAASTMQPQMPPEAPMDAPMEPPAEEMEDLGEPAPEEGDVSEETVGPDEDPGMAGVPSEMPPEAPAEFEDETVPETPAEIPAEGAGEELPNESGAEEFEEDMISQIKTMIGTTNDPEQLKGLSRLLSTALSQSRPAVPMQGIDTVETDTPVNPTVMKADNNLGVTVNDGEEVMKEALSGAVDNTLGVGFHKSDDTPAEAEETITVSEEPIPDDPDMTEEAPGAPDEVDAKIMEVAEVVADEVAEVVEEAIGTGVEEKTEESAEEAPAESGSAEETEEKSEEKTEEKKDDDGKEEEVSEKTESFEAKDDDKKEDKPLFKSAADMFAEHGHVGIDGMPAITKADVGDQYEAPAESDGDESVDASQSTEESEGENIIDQMNASSIGKSVSAKAMFDRAFSKMESRNATDADYAEGGKFAGVPKQLEQEEQDKADAEKKFDNVDRGTGEVKACVGEAPIKESAEPETPTETTLKSAKDAGIHLRSFADMYVDKGGFEKTAYQDVERPAPKAAVGGTFERPDLTNIQKSAEEKKPLQIGYGVDPHEAVADDWARYRALRDAGRL